MSDRQRIDFYFDYLSGYAYFAWLQVRALCERRGLELAVHPVLFAGLLNHWGQLGPAEIPPKRAFVYRYGFRWAALRGIPFECPRHHPFNPLTALRLSLPEVSGPDQHRVVDALWAMSWGAGGDLGSADELRAALDGIGVDGAALLARTAEPPVKEALKCSTADAIARGVFGIPTMFVAGELFWGNDQLDHIELVLDGRDPLDRAKVNAILARTRRAERRH